MNAAVQAEIERIEKVWGEARRRFSAGGPFLYGAFGAADAMYAPVVMRFRTYGVPLSAESARYCESMLAAPGIRAWIDEALKEKEFIAEEEPYATAPAAG